MDPGLALQDLDGYFAALRRRLAFRFVTRVAASVDALFAVDFVAFFGVIFFSATWFTSPFALFGLLFAPSGPQPHADIVRPRNLGMVCRTSRERR